jgi:ABC-type phosphate/phosphonate transport system substrate-binding protein
MTSEFIYFVFNDVASCSGNIVPNVWMTTEELIGNNLEGSDGGPI